jgi:hypothetical protein
MTVNFESLPQAVQELNAKMDNIMMFLQLAKPDVKQSDLPHYSRSIIFKPFQTFYTIRQTRMKPYMKKERDFTFLGPNYGLYKVLRYPLSKKFKSSPITFV